MLRFQTAQTSAYNCQWIFQVINVVLHFSRTIRNLSSQSNMMHSVKRILADLSFLLPLRNHYG